MNYSIIWSPEAIATFEDRITYLKTHFTEKEIARFKKRVNKYLKILMSEPHIGKRPGKLKDVHMGIIIEPVSLIYRIKSYSREVELISFVDNRQNPNKIKKYKP